MGPDGATGPALFGASSVRGAGLGRQRGRGGVRTGRRAPRPGPGAEAVASPRLRVALDATPLLGIRTGVGHVTARLIEELARCSDLEVRAYAISWRGREQLGEALPAPVAASTRRFPARLTRMFWPRFSVPPVEYWTGPVDVVHATNYVAPPAHAPVLLTVHDLTTERLADLPRAGFRRTPRPWCGWRWQHGAVIHTFSDFVAAEVREHYGLPDDRVVRIYPGLAPVAPTDPARGRRLAGADRYVLALGTVEPRKNLPALVRAFDAGRGEPTRRGARRGGPGRVGGRRLRDGRRRGPSPGSDPPARLRREDDRASLLAGAALLAYPSRYEGFGHPPLEAMQVGVPVVAAAAGALPEVLGDAASLVDPADVAALGEALARGPRRRRAPGPTRPRRPGTGAALLLGGGGPAVSGDLPPAGG